MTTPTPIELVVFDMAGTTVLDDGVVERAFQRAAERTGVATEMGWDAALLHVRETMGQSKIEVFTHIAGGDRARAEEATAAFEAAYAELIVEEGAAPIAGAREVLEALRAAGKKIALTTGFSPTTRDAILDRLGWGDLVDVALSPADVGRGRPAPDLVLSALIATETSAVSAVAVIGDTTSDVASGRAAGAGVVIGVLSGAHGDEALRGAGADHVIADVTLLSTLPELGL